MRFTVLVVIGLGLAGCVAPPIFTVASLALDGMSVIATGKTVGDQALSLVTRRDCAMWRLLAERSVDAVCRDENQTEVMVAAVGLPAPAANNTAPAEAALALDPMPLGFAPASNAAPMVASIPILSFARPVSRPPVRRHAVAWSSPPTTATQQPRQRTGATGARHGLRPGVILAAAKAPAANQAALYVVVGSFRQVANAETLRRRLGRLATTVTPAVVDLKVYFRVLAGPFDAGSLPAARRELATRGLAGAWPIRLCRGDLSAPPCANTARPMRLTMAQSDHSLSGRPWAIALR